MTRICVKKPDIRAHVLCGLTLLYVLLRAACISVAYAQEPPTAPGEAPAPPGIPKPKEPEREEEAPPATPLPGAPVAPGTLGLQAPSPTAPPPAPGLFDRFQRQLEVVPPGRILFNLTVDEQYDDNVFDDSNNRESDFATVIVPGLAVDRKGGNASVHLRYTPRIYEYVRFSELDRVDHSLVAAADWDATPWVRFSLQESLLSTEDVVESSPLGTGDTGRRRTTRNEVTPGAEFKLTPRSGLAFAYTNVIIDGEDTDDEEGDDGTINTGRVALTRRFLQGGATLEYAYSSGNFTESSDFVRHEGALNATWRVSPRDELLFIAGGQMQDESEEPDFTIVTGGVGLKRQFSPQVIGTVIVGVQRFEEDGSNADIGFSGGADLSWTFPRGVLTLGVVQRFVNTTNTVDNQGVVQSLEGRGTLAYNLTPSLSFLVAGGVGREEFEEEDREDHIYRAEVSIKYQLSPAFALRAGYRWFDRHSDEEGEDLLSNRVFIGLSMGFAAPLPF